MHALYTTDFALHVNPDVVVFPMLWLYRLARLGKRKIVNGIKRLFGPFDSFDAEVNGGVNGDNTASSSGSS